MVLRLVLRSYFIFFASCSINNNFFFFFSSAPAFMSYIGIDRPPVDLGPTDVPIMDEVGTLSYI
jgi:hypothetical protein